MGGKNVGRSNPRKEQGMTMKKTVAVFAELLKGPATRFDLAHKTDSNPKSVGRILNEMKAHKMIYVTGSFPSASWAGQQGARGALALPVLAFA
jgi:hypothetical protein